MMKEITNQNICDAKYSEKRNLAEHIMFVHEGKKLQCEFCEKSYNSSRNLLSHFQSVHEGRRYECNVCNVMQCL